MRVGECQGRRELLPLERCSNGGKIDYTIHKAHRWLRAICPRVSHESDNHTTA